MNLEVYSKGLELLEKLIQLVLIGIGFGFLDCHWHKDANSHMHSHNFEDLVAMFESPERDTWQKPDEVIAFIQKNSSQKKPTQLVVADLGAGTGYFAFRFLDKGYSVIALDVEDRFLQYINEKASSHPNNKNLKIQKIEKNSISLPTSSIDILISVNVYHHIDERVEYFKKIKKLMKKEGSIYIIDFKDQDTAIGPPKEMKVPKSQVIEEMKQAGYQVIVEEKLLPHQNIYFLK